MFALVLIAGNSKDLGDMAGDHYTGRKTMPMLIGVKATAWMTTLICIITGGLIIASFWFLPLKSAFVPPSLLGTTALIAGSIALLRQGQFAPTQIRRLNGLQAGGAVVIMLAYIVGIADPSPL